MLWIILIWSYPWRIHNGFPQIWRPTYSRKYQSFYTSNQNEKHLFKYYRLLKIKLLYCCTYFMHIETKILDNFCISLLRRMYFPDTIEINHLNVFILVFNHFMHFSIYIENFIEFISWETMCRICIRTHLRRKQCNELCRHLNLNYRNR